MLCSMCMLIIFYHYKIDDGEESKSANCLAYNIIITVQTLPLHAFETAKKVRQTAKDIIDCSTL